jgi:hypothetical protein
VLRRIGQGILILLALWGVVALVLVAYAIVSQPERRRASEPEETRATLAPPATTATTEVGAAPNGQAQGQGTFTPPGVVQIAPRHEAASGTMGQSALPALPLGWDWHQVTPNTPTSQPPDLLLGLPAGTLVIGESDWVVFWIPGGGFFGPNGVGPQLQRGQSCEGMTPTGQTWVVAGSPATVYRLVPRLPKQRGVLCFEFRYQGEPWRLMMIGIGPREWEMAYRLASYIVPKP